MVEEEISNKVNSGWVLVPENPDSSLTETVLQLSTSVTSLQRQPAPVSAEPRIGLPDKWNGVDGRPDGLLATLDMLFECQPTKYTTARAKVALLTSLLSGQAQEWAAALYYDKSAACNDYALFVEELKKTFWGDASLRSIF
uniref:DUF4939 domain-containing protein n=1 Tax=Haplochromis burtoni TaxID=8153 RepID=A0A3Q2VRT8_HAPBU